MKNVFKYLLVVTAILVLSNGSILSAQDVSIFTLKNGNQLSYVEYGNMNGKTLFYFHGFPGSHMDVPLFKGDSIAAELNIRLIAVNRPGYYLSTPAVNYTLIQWAEDLEELADHLNLQKFSILGYSGGAPFALAYAYSYPDRLENVGIVCGMGPANAPKAKKGSAMLIPKAPRLIMKGMSKMLVENPDKFKANMSKNAPFPDQHFYRKDENEVNLMKTIRKGLENGTEGAIQDAKIYKKKWGFELKNINREIILWHGVQDKNVPIETARYVVENLQECHYKFYNEEAHLSLFFNHTEEIFLTLTNK